jgi:hypothetical protein
MQDYAIIRQDYIHTPGFQFAGPVKALEGIPVVSMVFQCSRGPMVGERSEAGGVCTAPTRGWELASALLAVWHGLCLAVVGAVYRRQHSKSPRSAQ